MASTKSLKIHIPGHLKKYVVDQDYDRYTPEDQAVWRYVMRRLIDYLSVHAHPCYVDGLAKTGITSEFIPRIEEMDAKLREFGWSALPVSGFIPPAAFMEFQSLGILPIASDMRTIDHLLYTPAPDIVHEAAGHAPILVDPAFARYLKRYGEVASKAILSKEDMDQYEAIRVLSDTKEDPTSTKEQVAEAMKQLESATEAISYTSEAAFLGRMNWWTAEYGLIGDLNEPKIFGAGLLSSIGESKECLKPKVKKIPLTIHCLDYTYDITEQQPQLFVTPKFETLETVLAELGDRMAFRQGGLSGLERAKQAKTVNTVEFNSGLQVSGVLVEYLQAQVAGQEEPIYVRFQGPTQLSLNRRELDGHGTSYHKDGFGSPVGLLKNEAKCISAMDSDDLIRLGLVIGKTTRLEFASGVEVSGKVKSIMRGNGQIIVVAFSDCKVQRKGTVLFDPSWGIFDMAVGSSVPSVFGGPADRTAYGDLDDFVAKRVPAKERSPERLREFEFYQSIRNARNSSQGDQVQFLATRYLEEYPSSWLIGVELLELAIKFDLEDLAEQLEKNLNLRCPNKEDVQSCIAEGIRLAKSVPC